MEPFEKLTKRRRREKKGLMSLVFELRKRRRKKNGRGKSTYNFSLGSKLYTKPDIGT